MTKYELINIYNEYIQSISIVLYGMLFLSMFALAISLHFLSKKFKKQEKTRYSSVRYYMLSFFIIALLISVWFLITKINNFQDKDYEMVVKEYITPYIYSLVPVTYQELKLTEVISTSYGRYNTTTHKSKEIGALLAENVNKPRSELSKEFDKTFKLYELNYKESNKTYSYIEVRSFPFDLDEKYNTGYIESTAYMTTEDMQALINQNRIEHHRIEPSFANKLKVTNSNYKW